MLWRQIVKGLAVYVSAAAVIWAVMVAGIGWVGGWAGFDSPADLAWESHLALHVLPMVALCWPVWLMVIGIIGVVAEKCHIITPAS